MLFNKLFVFRRVEEPVPPDAGQSGGEVVRKMPKVTHDAKILQEDAGKGLVAPEAFRTPEAIMAALFPRYNEVEIREILGRKYNVLLGVLKGRIEARQQIFLGFKMTHNDVLVIWQQGEKREEMSLRSVCGIQLNDIAGFLGEEYQVLLVRAEKSMRNLEKWVRVSRFLLNVGFEKIEMKNILADNTNPYMDWFMNYIENLPMNCCKYATKQSKHFLGFRSLLKHGGQKEVFYRKKYVDFALNWKNLIYPGLKNIARGFDFKERVLPLIVAKNPVIEEVMVDMLEGFPVKRKTMASLLALFRRTDGGIFVPDKRVRTQVKNSLSDDSDDDLTVDGVDELERLLVDPELKELNIKRKELTEGAINPEITKSSAAGIRTQLVQHLDEIAEREPSLKDLNERFVKCIPDIEAFVDNMVRQKDVDGLDILVDVSLAFADKVPEVFKGGNSLSTISNGAKELYMRIVLDIITVKILSTNIEKKQGLNEFYNLPSNY